MPKCTIVVHTFWGMFFSSFPDCIVLLIIWRLTWHTKSLQSLPCTLRHSHVPFSCDFGKIYEVSSPGILWQLCLLPHSFPSVSPQHSGHSDLSQSSVRSYQSPIQNHSPAPSSAPPEALCPLSPPASDPALHRSPGPWLAGYSPRPPRTSSWLRASALAFFSTQNTLL